MRVDGTCGCGSVTFEADVEEDLVTICHCRDCQTQSGSAFRVVVPVKEDAFELRTGELKSFEKVADSGNVRSRTFCPECGTQIYAATLGDGLQFIGLRVGTLTQRDDLRPARQIWTRSRRDWLMTLDELPGWDVQPTDAELTGASDRG